MNITPSAISTQINELEKRYGIKLFQRTGNSLELTPFGMSLKNETDELFESVERVEGVLGKLKNRKSKIFNIGLESHEFALEILEQKKRLHDNYLMRFFELSHSHLIQMFEKHKIDILIANSTENTPINIKNNFTKYWLRNCRLCLISNPELCKQEKPIATNADLVELLQKFHVISRAKGSLTRSLQQKIYERLGMEENNFAEISNRESFIRLIKNKTGVGFMICDGLQKMDNLNYIYLPQNEMTSDILSINQYLYYMNDLEGHEIIKLLKSKRINRHHPT